MNGNPIIFSNPHFICRKEYLIKIIHAGLLMNNGIYNYNFSNFMPQNSRYVSMKDTA